MMNFGLLISAECHHHGVSRRVLHSDVYQDPRLEHDGIHLARREAQQRAQVRNLRSHPGTQGRTSRRRRQRNFRRSGDLGSGKRRRLRRVAKFSADFWRRPVAEDDIGQRRVGADLLRDRFDGNGEADLEILCWQQLLARSRTNVVRTR